MHSLLRRSPYNLRPRPTVTTLTKYSPTSPEVRAGYQVDVEVGPLAAAAQERHEQYLDGTLVEPDEPEVDDGCEQPVGAVRAADLYEQVRMKRGRVSSGDVRMDAPTKQIRTKASTAVHEGQSKQKLRSKRYSRKRRDNVRDAEVARKRTGDPDGARPQKACAQKHKRQAQFVQTSYSLPAAVSGPGAAVTKGAFTGKHLKHTEHANAPVTKDSGVNDYGLTLVEWDGATTVAVLDTHRKVVMVLGGTPQRYEHVLDEAERAYRDAQSQYHFKPSQASHRRGPYPAAGCGPSYGGGQQRVGNLKDTAHNRRVMEQCLLNNWAIKNIANFVDLGTFSNVAPEMHREYGRILSAVCEDNPQLRKNFRNSVFTGVTFNFGPKACTLKHKDHLNIPTGWCAVVALGDFDPDEGGHLIVWDLNLMIRFPRGSVIFLPSALFSHSNTVVPDGQQRYSFTQYTAGGLARWVECGFMSQKEFLQQGHAFSRTPQERWEEGLSKMPDWDTWGL